MIYVIDGPAGAGKSSTAKAIARKIGIHYVDSGAMYRGFTVIFIRCNKDENLFFDAIENHKLAFAFTEDKANVYLGSEEITNEIRSDIINSNVSRVAALAQVRAEVMKLLKSSVANPDEDYIAEGRDLGTVVFPDADIKFFLIADIEVRAQRRLKEISNTVDTEKLDEVKKNLMSRDEKDSSRKEAPLVKANDAIEIDTTSLSFEEQVDLMIKEIQNLKTGIIPN